MKKNMYKFNQHLNDQAFKFVEELYYLLRKNILPKGMFSWQEVSIILDCLIKMYNDLVLEHEVDEITLSSKLINLYEHSYKSIIDARIKVSNLYSINSFKQVICHLIETNKLRNTVILVYDEIRSRQQNWDNVGNDCVCSYLYHQRNYSPKDCLNELSRYCQLSCRDSFFVEKNSEGVFFVVEGGSSLLIEDGLLDYYDCSAPYDNAACIWPFFNGYARILGKDGRWGFLSKEDKDVKWIDENVLYADDFSCDRVRIQINDFNKTYKFLGLCLEDCFQKSFLKATNFDNGYAIVSDEFCGDYHIDVFGNIGKEDKCRYEEAKGKTLEEKRKSQKLWQKAISRRGNSSYDPETEIMDSLSGYGDDPELFGF